MMRGLSVEPVYFYRNGGTIAELEDWGVNIVRLHIIEASQWGQTVEKGLQAALRIAMDALTQGSKIQFLWSLRLECQCDYRAHLRWWREFKHRGVMNFPNLWGFDVVNEPWDFDKTMRGWKSTLPVFHEAMRALTDKHLVFQSGYWGTDSGFEIIAPFGDDMTHYGCNFWSPQTFTHQGVGNYPKGVRCPDNLRQIIEKDKARLLKWRDAFPDANLFIPEIGVSKYASEEDAERWIDTTVGLIEDMGASWCWHHYPGRIFTPRERLRYYFGLRRPSPSGPTMP